MFETLDGKRSALQIVEEKDLREDQLKVARMLCLLEACDLARPQ